MLRACPLLLLSLIPLASAADGTAKGSIRLSGQSVELVDAIATPFVSGRSSTLQVFATSLPIDRVELTEDGRVNMLDTMGLEGIEGNTVVEITLHERSPAEACFKVMGAVGSASACAGAQLSVREATRVAGRIEWSQGDDRLAVDFDLPVLDEVEPRIRGTRLPAGGGELGQVVMRNFAELASGDGARVRATLPPDRQAIFDGMAPEARAMALQRMRDAIPTGVEIVGGWVDGDDARVHFDGRRAEQAFRGLAKLVRIDGKWYVTGTSTRF